MSSTYFATLGIPMAAGVPWSESESRSDGDAVLPVVLAKRTAEYFFGSAEAAAGQTMWHVDDPTRRWLVTGVASDVRHWGLDQPVPDAVYLPTYSIPGGFRTVSLAVKTRVASSPSLQSSIRDAVWRVEPEIPVPAIVSMETMIEQSTAGRRFDSVLFGLFGLMGLLLVAAGLSGSLLFVVRQRARELAIRVALGATSSRVERYVVNSGLTLAVVGLMLGLVTSVFAGRFLRSRLYEIDAADPWTLVSASGVLLGTAVLASWLPARRAGRANPLDALKIE